MRGTLKHGESSSPICAREWQAGATGRRLLWGLPGLVLGLHLLVLGIVAFSQDPGWLGVGLVSVIPGAIVLGLTAATVVPERLKRSLVYLLLIVAALVAVACFFRWGLADARSWASVWPAALILIRMGRQRPTELSGTRAFWTAVTIVIVVALAPLASWAAFQAVTVASDGAPVQTSTSPAGRWEVATYFVDDAGFGPDSGLLRVDVRDLKRSPSKQHTAYVDAAENADMVERQITWIDADHVSVSTERGGSFQVDVARDTAPAPFEFLSFLAASAAALGVFVGALLVGVAVVFLVVTTLVAREAEQAAVTTAE